MISEIKHLNDIRSSPRNAAETPLGACLLHVAQYYDRPMTPADLDRALPLEQEAFVAENAIRVAEAAGFLAGFGKERLDALDAPLLPVILFLQNDRAVVLSGREPDGSYIIFDPLLGGGTGRVATDALNAAYTGFALILRPSSAAPLPGTDIVEQNGHWFWSTFSENRWMYVQVILAALVSNFLGLSTSIFIMVVYDRVLPNEAMESLIALTIGVGLALLFDFLIKTLRAGFVDRAGQKADKIIGRRLFDHLLRIRMRAKTGSTGAMSSIFREFETLRDFITSATLVAVVDLPFIFLFIGVIYLIGGPLALVPAIAVPVVLIIGIAVQPFLSRLAERSFRDGQSKQSVLVETLSGLETIKVVGASRQMRARWDAAIEQQADHSVRSRSIAQLAMNATAFTQQTAQVMIVFYGVFLISNGWVSMGALIASVILTGRTLAPLAQLAQILTRLNQARASYRSLNTLMQTESEQPTGKRWLSRPRLAGDIAFQNVRFGYANSGMEALRNISFEIKSGEKVAILGKIGSGKSTIGKLLLGLHTPNEGAVLVDQTDVRQINPEDLRRNIGAVLQDVWLFSGSVRDNIAIGAYGVRDEEVLAAARASGADHFISRDPAGYDLQLKERGEGLSGGQLQSITLARALVGRKPILLLDEPTSAMDAQTELEIIQNLRVFAADKTLIVITHRPALLDLVDRVILINNGEVAADGPKSELRRKRVANAGG